jgi:1-acyl-sn-glycerol-3-phosphate acyltransferase
MIHRRTYCEGLDAVHALRPERGVIVAANHRSFFDLYTMMTSFFWWGGNSWTKRMFYPVRSNFFYEHPLGTAVNFAIGGGSMYPPIFRDPGKAALNQVAVDRVIAALGEPGTLVGMHPEGTRGKGDDPYELLPAQPGIGQMILAARPTVIPLFVNGLDNDLLGVIRRTYTPEIRRKAPLTLVWGEPVDYSDFLAQKPRAALYKRVADRVLERIAALGERERVLRAEIAAGQHDAGANWLSDRGCASLW